MATNNDHSSAAGVPDTTTATSGSVSGPEIFTERADLTNKTFIGLSLSDASVQQGLLSGTLFRNCTFQRFNFRRCDFEGSAFEDCRFTKCDFSIADFRSVEAARTSFDQCKFDEGSTNASMFNECTFEGCTYPLHSFETTKLIRSIVTDCLFQRSTMLHDEFSDTRFIRSDLADCTSQYHLFSNCAFEKSRINAEAVGLTFGLTRQNLVELGLTWRGTQLPRHGPDTETLIHDLMITYRTRGWALAAAILRPNCFEDDFLPALNEAFAAIAAAAASLRPLKGDEITFFARIIEHLSSVGQLPLIAVVGGLEAVARSAELRAQRDLASLKMLHHVLNDAEFEVLRALDLGLAPLLELSGSTRLRVAFVYDEKPLTSVRDWFATLDQLTLMPHPPPRFLHATQGSYIEVFWFTAQTLASVLIGLCMLERIIDRLVYVRARMEVLFADRLPPAIRRRALLPITTPSQNLVKELNSWMTVFGDTTNRELVSNARNAMRRLKQIDIDSAPDDHASE
jgi:uncharacterized protein YjbI with pentapeptide repeats